MGIRVTGVHHLMITVGDLDTAKQFYGSVLGLEETVIPPEIGGDRAWYRLGPVELHVNVHPEHKAGNQHFAISVEHGKYEAYIEQVRKTGYKKITKTQKYIDGHYRTYIDDPFGNCIELIDAQVGA